MARSDELIQDARQARGGRWVAVKLLKNITE
jgi:hypothetical protein